MNYLWECKVCGVQTEVMCKIDDRDIPPTDPCHCVDIGASWERLITPPNFTRRTFIDGGRKSDKNFQDAKRALQLEVDSARSNNADDKKQMSQEIKRLRSTKP